ncbi:MAG: hypothetical protein O2782_00940 [bacterium]|nr:hypothetical protein [bacterium]
MASATDRFSRLEKLAIFLIALGQERTREILADVDVDTLQHLNGAIAGLGDVSATEKAAVMLEFAHFFYADEAISAATPPPAGKAPARKNPGRKQPARRDVDTSATKSSKQPEQLHLSGKEPTLSSEEQAILQTLDKLRRKVDPGQIDWGRAGYDFGDGFKGADESRR